VMGLNALDLGKRAVVTQHVRNGVARKMQLSDIAKVLVG